MLKRKSSGSEKKRKHSQSEERREGGKRRSTEDSKDDLADPELDRIGSDIEEGGLDLNTPFKPITAYVKDQKEMLEQCFHVLGEKKLRKMLPDEFKDYSLEEIKKLCWEQLEPIPEKNVFQILAGEDLTNENENSEETLESQQDNIVDSTSCLKETVKAEEPKQEGSSEESDVLSINADTYDSDIEAPKEEQAAKTVDVAVKVGNGGKKSSEPPANPEPAKPEPKKGIQHDIEKSVNEILASSSTSKSDAVKEQSETQHPADVSLPDEDRSGSTGAAGPSQPSIQQLELLELEMRARAIKALMKASDGKKPSLTKPV